MSSHNDSFVASGSSPTVDFLCENHGSIFLLRPVSPASFDWIESHLPSDRITLGNAVAVDHRCIWAILAGLQDDGLVVSRGSENRSRKDSHTFGGPYRPLARLRRGRLALHENWVDGPLFISADRRFRGDARI
jgi:hypothetical protein